MNLFLQRVLSSLASEALTLIPSKRIPHIRKVIDSHSDFSNLSAKQRQELAQELVQGLSAASKKSAAKAKPSTTKGKKK